MAWKIDECQRRISYTKEICNSMSLSGCPALHGVNLNFKKSESIFFLRISSITEEDETV